MGGGSEESQNPLKTLEYHPAQPWNNLGEQRGWILPILGNEEQLPGGFPSKTLFPHGIPSSAPEDPDPNPSLPSTWSYLESKQFPSSAAPPAAPGPASHTCEGPREFLPKQSRDRVLWLPRSDPQEQWNETLPFPSFPRIHSKEKMWKKIARSSWMKLVPKKSKHPPEYLPPLGSASKWEKMFPLGSYPAWKSHYL